MEINTKVCCFEKYKELGDLFSGYLKNQGDEKIIGKFFKEKLIENIQ